MRAVSVPGRNFATRDQAQSLLSDAQSLAAIGGNQRLLADSLHEFFVGRTSCDPMRWPLSAGNRKHAVDRARLLGLVGH